MGWIQVQGKIRELAEWTRRQINDTAQSGQGIYQGVDAQIPGAEESKEGGCSMKKFYPKTTVQAPEWCPKCGRETQWAISGGRPLHCLNVHPTPKPVEKPVKVERSGDLF